jgi:hypothetical protein
MPDGPSVEIRVTADTGGVDAVNSKLGELRLQAEATRRAAQQLGADFRQLYDNTQKLGGGSAQAQAALKETAGYLAQVESQARAANAELRDAGKDALSGAARGVQANSGVIREVIVELHELVQGRFTRMGSSALVLAERMGSLDKVVGALKGPFGIALGVALALAGGLYEVVSAARAAEAALQGAWNAALAGGRNAALAEGHVKAMGDTLTGLGEGPQTALPFAAQLEAIPGLSAKARESLLGVSQAAAQAMAGGDFEKLGKDLDKMFSSAATMKATVDKNRLLTGAAYQQFSAASAGGDTEKMATLLARGINQRYAPAQAELQRRMKAQGGSIADLLAQAGSPETSLGNAGAAPADVNARLPGPLTLPSAAEMRVNKDIAEGNKLQNERAGYLVRIKEIQDAITAGAAKANDETRNALGFYNKRVGEIDKQLVGGGQLGVMEGLREKLKEQDAAIASSAANAKAAHTAMHANDVQYWTQALAGDKLNAKERADIQMELFGAKEAAALGALPSGAGGGRAAKGPSALSQRGGGPEARSQYEDFAAGEREKIAAAEGSSTQIQAIYQEWSARAKAQFGDTSREYQSVLRAMTEATAREAAAQAREIAAASRAAYEQFAGAERDKIAAAQGATSQILAIYQEWADRAKAVFGEQSTQYENVVRQMTEAANRASEQMQAAFAKPFDSLGSSAERALTGLLTHQTTVGKAEQEAYRGLIGSSVDELGTAANKTLASSLFGSGTKSLGEGLVGMLGVGKPGGLFGTGLGAVTGETTETTLATAVTANTAAVTANTAALTTSAGAAVSGGALSGAGGIASGAGSFLGSLPLIGSLFGGGAVSGAVDQDFSGGVGIGGGGLFAGLGALFGFKGGGIMPRTTGAIVPRTTFRLPSYAAGGFAVPGLAKLHENEMVLPAHISNFVQNAAAAASGGGHGGDSGNTHLHFHGPADGPAIERFLTPFIRRAVPGAVQNAFRSNALTPRTV